MQTKETNEKQKNKDNYIKKKNERVKEWTSYRMKDLIKEQEQQQTKKNMRMDKQTKDRMMIQTKK